MATVCVIANLFLLTKNDIILHYNTFPHLGVCNAKFPNLKGPRAPSQNCTKNPWMITIVVMIRRREVRGGMMIIEKI